MESTLRKCLGLLATSCQSSDAPDSFRPLVNYSHLMRLRQFVPAVSPYLATASGSHYLGTWLSLPRYCSLHPATLLVVTRTSEVVNLYCPFTIGYYGESVKHFLKLFLSGQLALLSSVSTVFPFACPTLQILARPKWIASPKCKIIENNLSGIFPAH